LDASGNFVVVWAGYSPDGSTVFGQIFARSGAPLGPEFQLNTYTTSSQYSPAVASDSSGNLVVVWQSYAQDGSTSDIFGQRYDSSGARLGPEFRVNAYTTSSQIFPAVTSDSSGNFVVVWNSYSQDGSRWGVFGQRYSAIAPVK
jgi:large repetitive protein